MSAKEHFDVLIIGAGISGLTSAALLSKAGLKVCVLEKHYLIGGYLQGFQRKEFIFDTAIHWLNQCGEHGTVTKVFNYLGSDFPKPVGMKLIHRHVGNHHDYALTNNPDELQQRLVTDFPHEQEGIQRFFKDARKIAEISLKFPKLFRSSETMSGFEKIAYMLRRMSIGLPMVKHVFYSGEAGVTKGLNRYFKDPGLHQLFCAERDLLSCLFPIAWAYNNDYQNPPIGGSQAFPAWLEGKIATGSEIRLNCSVSEIVLENNRFKELICTTRGKKHTVSATHLIAACDVEVLYEKLLPADAVPDKFKQNLHKSELYSSSVTISVALDCPAETLGFGTELVLLCDDSGTRDDHTSGDPHKSAISILAPTVRDKTLAPENCGTLTLYVPAWMSYENNWRTETDKNGKQVRGEAYKALKHEFANIVIDRVVKRVCPQLREHILFYEVATPITYQRYTANKNGTMMGTRPGKINMQAKVAHYHTPVDNIIVGGHWAELGGGVPIAVKAAYNASLIVLKEQNQLKASKELIDLMEND